MHAPSDQPSRALAAPASRRAALKVLGAATAAAAGALLLRPFRGAAVTCPAGAAQCGGGCCEAGATCNFGLGCCCPKGTAPCGNTCCNKGIACLSVANSLCGCPPKTT